MVDGNSTTVDWQEFGGDVCVLPIGSFEQHSDHMPLDTDSIQADYFSRMLAEGLDAALLPTIRIATSLEHTGFRGSMSLKPETVMQIIRDLADELEAQDFRILIIANHHGGNHFIVPVARHINRSDRKLKILHISPYEFSDPGIEMASKGLGPTFHSGEWETSVMMALRPDLVRSESRDICPEQGEAHPLRQSDLTTFGMGHFASHGAIGFPSYASVEKGEQIIESVRRNMLPFVQDRIQRLRKNWRYGGPAE